MARENGDKENLAELLSLDKKILISGTLDKMYGRKWPH